jgi:hypothetical protein
LTPKKLALSDPELRFYPLAGGGVGHVDSRIEIAVQESLVQREAGPPAFGPVSQEEIGFGCQAARAYHRRLGIRPSESHSQAAAMYLKDRGVGAEPGSEGRRLSKVSNRRIHLLGIMLFNIRLFNIRLAYIRNEKTRQAGGNPARLPAAAAT